jgi:hypothetical protein
MDSQHAFIAGRKNVHEGNFVILGQVGNAGASGNSNENAFSNQLLSQASIGAGRCIKKSRTPSEWCPG